MATHSASQRAGISSQLPIPSLGAPDPDGWRGREHVLPLFLNDDTDAQERIIKHLILSYAIGDLHLSYLHDHACGCLSAFHKKDPLDGKICPINNSSQWHRDSSVKKEADVYFTEQFPNFIQTTGSVDCASVCAKIVSMMYYLTVIDEDQTIICQIDFANAFQTTSRQLGTNNCILGIVSHTYDQERVQICDPLPHLKPLKKFFPYFCSMNDMAS